MSDPISIAASDCVFQQQGQHLNPTGLSRGPWSPDAQHGGAPAALIAALAEEALAGEGYQLVRLTLELVRPVPVAPLESTIKVGGGRTVRRVSVCLQHQGRPVAEGLAVLVLANGIDTGQATDEAPLPAPGDCQEPVTIPGMSREESFHYTAMESRVARGRTDRPGPAAAWLRLTVPLIEDRTTTATAGAVAAADFGNGLSWVLPLDRYLFANTDLTVYLQRPPVSEWVGLDSQTWIEPSGIGLTRSVLHDEQGPIGVAQQNLLVRERRP
ncbi:acyl-CoA thioesterase domain-containing protein [Alloalcanivorax xenomutans]|uniref:acyl-CoA thioesterase domain-containing protein n=1 Tax=Alloalcanivorax xenomutans TaxID=1094342 RepID=UPI0024E1CF60|nr:acyl-CoA thioesterase domain-containing protein [Alloalcanivorax xenomutans]